MNDEKFPLLVDSTLTYENARLQGYQWQMDLLRNEQGNIVALEEVVHLVNEEGYKVGQPWADEKRIAPYGLYKPVRKRDPSRNVSEQERAELKE